MKEKDLMYILENDEPCVNIGGICQQDTLSCPGGYQSGLCGGGEIAGAAKVRSFSNVQNIIISTYFVILVIRKWLSE